jgi:hypothetical protein
VTALRTILKIVLVLIAASPVLAPCLLFASMWIDDTFIRPKYYEKRPIVSAMHAAGGIPEGGFTAYFDPYRQALLQHIPRGTAKAAATAPLEAEGFWCNQTRPTDEDRLICSLFEDPGIWYILETKWQIEIRFENDKLSSLSVLRF